MQFNSDWPYNIEGFLQSQGPLSFYMCRHRPTHVTGILSVYNPGYSVHVTSELESQCKNIREKLGTKLLSSNIKIQDDFLSLNGYYCFFWSMPNPNEVKAASQAILKEMEGEALEELNRIYNTIRPIFRMACPECGEINEAFLGDKRACKRANCGNILVFNKEVTTNEIDKLMEFLTPYRLINKNQDPRFSHRTCCTFSKNTKDFWLWEDIRPTLSETVSLAQEKKLRDTFAQYPKFKLNSPLETVSISTGGIRRVYQSFPGTKTLKEHMKKLKFSGYFIIHLFHRLVELIDMFHRLNLIHGLFTIDRFLWFDGKGGESLVLNDFEGIAVTPIPEWVKPLELPPGYYPPNIKNFGDLEKQIPHALLYAAAMLIFYLVSDQPIIRYLPTPDIPLPNLRNFSDDLIPGFTGILTDCWLRYYNNPLGIEEVLDATKKVEESYLIRVESEWAKGPFSVVSQCDPGLKPGVNEDSCKCKVLTLGRRYAYLMVAADGISGSCEGHFASNIVVDTISELAEETLFAFSTKEIFKWMTYALNEANVRIGKYILSQSNDFIYKQVKNPSGSTVVLGIVRDYSLYYAWSGDSRIYLLRKGELDSLTTDDNWLKIYLRPSEHGQTNYNQIIDRKDKVFELSRWIGFFEEEENPDGNIVYNLQRPKTLLLSFGHLTLIPGDRVLLCSDGLSDLVNDSQIAQILREEKDAQKCCTRLINTSRYAQEMYLNKKDNIACVLLTLTPEVGKD